MRFRAVALTGLVIAALSACTADLPDLPDRSDDALTRAPYPDIVPIDRLIDMQAPVAETDDQTTENLEARVAGLQARAAQLQDQSGIDPETRNRLNARTSGN